MSKDSVLVPVARQMGNELAVETVDLFKVYRLGTIDYPALRGVSLKVRRGEFISIVGPSGSGKTTLMNLLGALDRPTAGRVFIDATDIFTLNDRELAAFRNRKIGFIFQFHNLIMRTTVERNIELPLMLMGMKKEERLKRVTEILTAVGLADKIRVKPNLLSGGQQQRVAVARALVTQPTIILGDEPTGSLDSKTGAEVVALMKKMCKDLGTTFIVVTHNPEVANETDRIVHIRDGRVVKDEVLVEAS